MPSVQAAWVRRQAFGRSRGGFTTKIHLRVNGAGLPKRSDITSSQTSDDLGFDLVTDDNLPEPSVLLPDRGYDSDKVWKTVGERNVVPVTPMRKFQRLRIAVDRTIYRLRNLTERCFNKLKSSRRGFHPLRQDRRELPGLHRHHLNPPLAPPFVNMT